MKSIPSITESLASEAFKFRATLDVESDRGCALMAGAYIDDRLKRLISESFVHDKDIHREFFNFSGPLGGFSARITYAFLSGKLSKAEYRDLNLIRKIRNDFGHTADLITFDTPSIAQRCTELYHVSNLPLGSPPRRLFTSASLGVLSRIDRQITHQTRFSAPPDIEITAEQREQNHKEAEQAYAEFIGTFSPDQLETISSEEMQKQISKHWIEKLNSTDRDET